MGANLRISDLNRKQVLVPKIRISLLNENFYWVIILPMSPPWSGSMDSFSNPPFKGLFIYCPLGGKDTIQVVIFMLKKFRKAAIEVHRLRFPIHIKVVNIA